MSDVEQLAPKDEVQQEVQQSAETTHFGLNRSERRKTATCSECVSLGGRQI